MEHVWMIWSFFAVYVWIKVPHFCRGVSRTGIITRGTTINPFLRRPMNTHSTRCPESHRYSFNHGKHCCLTGLKLNSSSIQECDGNLMDFQSNLLCCPGGQYVECQKPPCSDKPLEAYWTSWTEWECDTSTNLVSRSRSCPTKAHVSLQTCPHGAEVVESFLCEGLWSNWVFDTTCSQTCESGTRERTRVCDNPAPSSKSQQCLLTDGTRGLSERDLTFPCNLGTCEGVWSNWVIEPNSCTIGWCNGNQSRSRSCDEVGADGNCLLSDGVTRDTKEDDYNFPCQAPSCCSASPTIHSHTPPFGYNDPNFGNRFGPSTLFVDQCETFGPPSNYYITDDAITNAFIVIDTGCHNSYVTTIELKNVHNGHGNDRGTKDFSVSVSNDPDSGWDVVVTDTLPSAINVGCASIPLKVYELKRYARYLKLLLITFYEFGPGLQYVNINFDDSY